MRKPVTRWAPQQARVLLDELVQMPAEQLYLPVSRHPKVQALAEALAADPGDRSTIRQWAARLALGERTLTRLIERETGLSFGRWPQPRYFAARPGGQPPSAAKS